MREPEGAESKRRESVGRGRGRKSVPPPPSCFLSISNVPQFGPGGGARLGLALPACSHSPLLAGVLEDARGRQS